MPTSIDGINHKTTTLDVQSSSKKQVNPLDVLPVEVSLGILSKLTRTGLGRCLLVSKQWKELASDEGLWKAMRMPKIAFGVEQWEEYFGVTIDPADVPPLPRNIQKILKSQCLFSEKGKKVKETHLLVLIPENINGKPLTLETFGEIVKLKFPELGPNGYRFIWEGAKGGGTNGKSHWVLLTKDILSGSTCKSFEEQQAQINDQGLGKYVPPKTIDVVVGAISEYARSDGKTRLFGANPGVYTRCQKHTVGCFTASGLSVIFDKETSDFVSSKQGGIDINSDPELMACFHSLQEITDSDLLSRIVEERSVSGSDLMVTLSRIINELRDVDFLPSPSVEEGVWSALPDTRTLNYVGIAAARMF